MTFPAIQIEGLGKRYRVNHEVQRADYKTLRESLMDLASLPVRRLRGEQRRSREDFWALKEIELEIRPGDIVGIVGRNGAGKSTLLKILSQITRPTTGRVTLNGRIGSLLEVGTGFHPELTGRENVYLNGSILGMRKEEIRRKFDEIVAFAEVEKFLDTPVKRYSSGMYVRLAFAVAAHLEPEILIIDEVLAVGDAQFQSKCLGKLEDVAQHGRTVLFVSHQMAAVRRLCQSAIMLDKGRLIDFSDTESICRRYLASLESQHDNGFWERRHGMVGRGISHVSISVPDRDHGDVLVAGEPVGFHFEVTASTRNPHIVFTIYDQSGAPVSNFDTKYWSGYEPFSCVEQTVVCSLPQLLLRPGRYRLNVALFDGKEICDHVEGAVFFDVIGGRVGNFLVESTHFSGYAIFPHCWNAGMRQATSMERVSDVGESVGKK
jgi:lipopolysaccharide transport system ATP-binding protein